MEPLQRLTRRQVDALRVISEEETVDRGVPLKAIAAVLRISPPSALDHLTLLERSGLVERHRGKSRLTARGRNTLVEYRRHHRIAESMFSRLGFSPDDVCAAAREVDLALSHKTIERVCAAEQHPEVCPHGQRIPPCATDRSAA